MGLFVLLVVLWLGFAVIAYSVARRVEPNAPRRRAVAAAAAGASLLVAPAWLAASAIVWAQGTRRGRRMLARLGLYTDAHNGAPVEVVRLHDPADCTACYTGTLCPG